MGLGSWGRSGYGEGVIESSHPSDWGLRRNQQRRPRSPQCAQQVPQQTGWPGEDRASAAGVGEHRQFSLLQLPGTRPTKSTKRQQSRPCLSDSKLPYVLAFLLFLLRNEMRLVIVRIFLSCQEGSPVPQIGRVQGGMAVDLLCFRLCCCLSSSF